MTNINYDYHLANPRIIKALRFYSKRLNSLKEDHTFNDLLINDILNVAEKSNKLATSLNDDPDEAYAMEKNEIISDALESYLKKLNDDKKHITEKHKLQIKTKKTDEEINEIEKILENYKKPKES